MNTKSLNLFFNAIKKVIAPLLIFILFFSVDKASFASAKGSMVQSASNGLTVTLSADQPTFSQEDEVIVHITFANNNTYSLKVLNWFVPTDGIKEPIFTVNRDGNLVPYVGAFYKRLDPTVEDYITLAPGESLSYDVNLADHSDLSETGNYTIQYQVVSEQLYTELSDAPTSLSSNEITVSIEGRAAKALPEIPAEALKITGSNTFISCTASEQTLIATARVNAGIYAANAAAYLFSGNLGTRYTKWFGAFDNTRYNTVLNNFSAISSAMNTGNLRFDCTCNLPSTFAYVYPTDTTKTTYLCGAFWSAAATGTDSKAGTLVHEMSHFNAVAGTDDHVYGQVGAQNLAINNPALAIQNADSHEYFAENTPADQPPPSNDNIDTPSVINSLPFSVSGVSTLNATTSVIDPALSCSSNSQRNRSIWYRYTPVFNEVVNFNTFGSSYDTILAVWSGDTLSLVSSGCNDDTGGGILSELEVTLTSGKTYYIEVVSLNTVGGSANLSATVVDILPSRAVISSNGAQDGWVRESTETSEAGGTVDATASVLIVGDDASDRQYRSVLSFDTSSLPDTAVISQATLAIRVNEILGGGNPLKMFNYFMADVTNGSFGTSTLAAQDFQLSPTVTVGPLGQTNTGGGWLYIDLKTAKVNINPTGLTQVRLRYSLGDNDNGIENILKFYSGNYATAKHRPQLNVWFSVP